MNEPKKLLKKVVDALEGAGIDYMVSGSLGSSYHGLPRATNDVDIVISATETQLETFARSLGDDYYISPNAMREALKNCSMFNVIDNLTGGKADLVIRKQRAFSIEEFQRRRKADFMDLDVWMLSPEDAILSKLEWTGGEVGRRQFEDAVGVAVVQFDKLDFGYLKKWAKELKIEVLLEQLLEQAKKLKEEQSTN